MSLLIGASSPAQGASGAQGAAADLGDTINQSLRFRGSTLSRTLTNHTSFTASMWIKRGSLGTEQTFFEFSAADADLRFTANDELKYFDNATAGTSDKLFRDPSAWYHIVLAYDNDGTGGLGSDTVRIYVNGVDSGLRTSAGGNSGGGSTVLGSSDFEGYIAEFNYVQSTQLPTAFGKINNDGVWVPITFTGTYGAQGVHLIFDSSAGIGDDTSGNENDFTASGFDTTAISSSNTDNDIDYNDTPTNNYSTLQPLGYISDSLGGNPSPTNANLGFTISSNPDIALTYYLLPTSGKYYFEIITPSATAGESGLRLYIPATANTSQNGTGSVADLLSQGDSSLNRWITQNNGTLLPTGNVSKTTQSSRMQVAVDADNKKIYCGDGTSDQWLHRDGTYQISAFDATKPTIDYSSLTGDAQLAIYGTTNTQVNFGQMPFLFTQPTGFDTTTVFRSKSLPEPTIKNGAEYFETIIWDGDGNDDRDITTTEGFAPDLVWIKCRNAGENHTLFDTIRGATKRLITNFSNAEDTQVEDLQQFNSDGFQIGTQDRVNKSGRTYVAWCWKAGGTAVSNTDGTITSSVSANTDAGFSIVSWTGTQTSGQTVGHGLTEAPDLVIYKARDESANWIVGSSAIGATELLILDVSNAVTSNSNFIPSRPTNSVLNLGSVSSVNNDEKMIAYCWHSVEGFSKAGSYEGDGSSDGPFVYTGFEVQWLIVKRTDGAANWVIYDTEREPINPNDVHIFANLNNSENTSSSFNVDLLSNGFKLRGNSANINASGGDYIYMAFGAHPFGGENAPPATAR